MKKKLNVIVVLLSTAIFAFTACSKNDNGTSTVNIRMTDAPASFDKVNIDIREVRVNLTGDSASGWTTLNTKAGIYDLLTLQNGKDTLLATGQVTTGKLKQVRFVLGPNNDVIVGGVSFPLTIPSGSESGLKINVDKNLNATLETLIIDFDAAASIRLEVDGSYKLRPVLQVK
ncbi:MAG: DUF4382 domain-containing protein [Ferruginibacter sp.]